MSQSHLASIDANENAYIAKRMQIQQEFQQREDKNRKLLEELQKKDKEREESVKLLE